jgi:hypothetical protein
MYASKNIFSNNVKKIEVKLTNEYFPSLTKVKVVENTSENVNSYEIEKNTSYVDKLNTIIEEISDEDVIKPGWVKISIDKNNKIHSVYNNSQQKELVPINECEQFKKNIQPMFDRWENYKINYIELYGEDNYNYYHIFPNYDYSYLNKVEQEELSDFEEN